MEVAPSPARRLRLVYFGSGAFGLPTFESLRARHDVELVVSQPARPAGRGGKVVATPIAARAAELGLPLRAPENANQPEEIAAIRAVGADAFVVIAFGQKLSPALLAGTFAINLHASLLPAYRGAAPINWAMIDGCDVTGVSVIGLAERMDAGLVYARRALSIDPGETAGELHDRLAALGPEAVLSTLDAFAADRLSGESQEEPRATRARKLTKADERLDLASLDASAARARIHGLSPWPGSAMLFEGKRVRILRVRDLPDDRENAAPGTILADGSVQCRRGRLQLLEVQPEGGRPMPLADFRNGRRFEAGMRFEPMDAPR